LNFQNKNCGLQLSYAVLKEKATNRLDSTFRAELAIDYRPLFNFKEFENVEISPQ
jgi:hypothetical protein